MTLIDDPATLDAPSICAARPEYHDAIRKLHALRFGPGRFARSAYRLREGAAWPSPYCQIALSGDQLFGSVTATPIKIGDGIEGILVGPVVVAEAHIGKTFGQQMIEACVRAAEDAGEQFALLVGDLDYYQRVGFQRALPPVTGGPFSLPGPADPDRILVRPLNGCDLSGVSGRVQPRI